MNKETKRNPEVWVTADLHLNHANILEYCKRPFSTIRDMNETFIRNWNSVVHKQDTIYILGDFAFGTADEVDRYVARLNGNKIFLMGNHDRGLIDWSRKNRVKIHNDLMIRVDGEELFLSHYAHRVWNKSHYGVIHCFGHSHNGLEDYMLSTDVGVDTKESNFTPINVKSIIARMIPIREKLINEGKIFRNKKR